MTIARALMTNPDRLLFLEPSEGLAPGLLEKVFTVTQQLKAAGRSIVLVEQDFGRAMEIAGCASITSGGTVVYGPTLERLMSSESVKSEYPGLGQ